MFSSRRRIAMVGNESKIHKDFDILSPCRQQNIQLNDSNHNLNNTRYQD